MGPGAKPPRRTAGRDERIVRGRSAVSRLGLTFGIAGLLVSSCVAPGQTVVPDPAAGTSQARAPASSAAVDSNRSGNRTPQAQNAKLTVVAHRRITEQQYQTAIADLFGPAIKVDGRFEPELRKEGLLAIGASEVSISDAGFAQYFAIARRVADQVLLSTPAQRDRQAAIQDARDKVVSCAPARADGADAACAERFVRTYGERLFRRPLTDAEVATRVQLAEAGAVQNKDFYEGLKLSLISLLTAPDFLFRLEAVEPDPAHPGSVRLDGYSKASRLSYLMWDAEPDAELLAAAKNGSIHTTAGLQAQIDRLAANPARREAGLRAFFADMLDCNMFDDQGSLHLRWRVGPTDLSARVRPVGSADPGHLHDAVLPPGQILADRSRGEAVRDLHVPAHSAAARGRRFLQGPGLERRHSAPAPACARQQRGMLKLSSAQ